MRDSNHNTSGSPTRRNIFEWSSAALAAAGALAAVKPAQAAPAKKFGPLPNFKYSLEASTGWEGPGWIGARSHRYRIPDFEEHRGSFHARFREQPACRMMRSLQLVIRREITPPPSPVVP
jgi:hypothetical protein